MRTLTNIPACSDRPFQTKGVSVYVGFGQIRDRRLRVVNARTLALRVPLSTAKTARIHFEPSAAGELEFTLPVPVDLLDQSGVLIDVRHCAEDHEAQAFAPQAITIDSGGDSTVPLSGSAILISAEVRSSGSARINVRYRHRSGVPAQLRLARTAGPTSPADVITPCSRPGLYEIDTAVLSAGTYTFALSIETAGAVASHLLLSAITVEVDLSGPDGVTDLEVLL